MTNLQAERFRNAVKAGTHVVLPFQYFLRNGGQDALTEVAAAAVHIKAGHWQDDPIAIIFPVGMVVGDQITDIGRSFFA